MSQTIRKSIGEGFAHNPIYAALAYDANDHFGGYEIKDVMFNATHKAYFRNTDSYLYSDQAGRLRVHGDLYVDGALSYSSTLVSLSQTLGGHLTVGSEGTGGGFNVIFWGDLSDKYWKWLEESNTMAVKGAFTITGNSTLTGTLNVTGTTTLAVTNIVGAVGIDGDVTMAGDDQINFRTSSIYVNSADAGHLDLVANTAIDITATDVVITGIVALTGATTVTGALSVTTTSALAGIVTLSSTLIQGATGGKMTLTAGSPVHDVWTTCASTGTMGEAVRIMALMTANGGRGRALLGTLTTGAVKLGNYSNAIKGYIDITDGSGSSGLLSAICAEMKMPDETMVGTFGVLELELVCPSSFVANEGLGANCVSFIYAQLSGTAGEIDEHGYFLNVQGLTTGDGELLYNNTLKCVIGTTKLYLPFSTAQGTYTTAYPIVIDAVTTSLTISGAATNALTITITGSTATDGSCIKVGTSGTPITTATTGMSAVKVYSDYSKTDGYHVGAWYSSRYTVSGGDTGSVYTLRGHADYSGTQTTASANQFIVGVHGRVVVSGTVANEHLIMAGTKGQVIDSSGTFTSAKHLCGLWGDWQLDNDVSGITYTELLFLENNANNSTANNNPNSAIHIYGPYVTNFVYFQTCGTGGMTGVDTEADYTFTYYKKIKISIDGTTYYLIADRT